MKITRRTLSVRLESHLAALLVDLCEKTNRTLGEYLEETLMHTFEATPGMEGEAVASPHTKETLALIQELKRMHGVTYDAHDTYAFVEAPAS